MRRFKLVFEVQDMDLPIEERQANPVFEKSQIVMLIDEPQLEEFEGWVKGELNGLSDECIRQLMSSKVGEIVDSNLTAMRTVVALKIFENIKAAERVPA